MGPHPGTPRPNIRLTTYYANVETPTNLKPSPYLTFPSRPVDTAVGVQANLQRFQHLIEHTLSAPLGELGNKQIATGQNAREVPATGLPLSTSTSCSGASHGLSSTAVLNFPDAVPEALAPAVPTRHPKARTVHPAILHHDLASRQAVTMGYRSVLSVFQTGSSNRRR